MKTALIALDWGTTSFRAYRFGQSGEIMETKADQAGILQVPRKEFEGVFIRLVQPWLEDNPRIPLIASGMITSKQGWVETGYISCPAGLAQLAEGLVTHCTISGHTIHFVPGVTFTAPNGVPDVIRGEETQVFGATDHGGSHRLFVLPGTHSKWLLTRGERIDWFATFMTGEIFSVLKDHTILGELSVKGSVDKQAFLRGVDYALDLSPEQGGLLHKVFSARSLVLLGNLSNQCVESYLSGLLIGIEIVEGYAYINKKGLFKEATLVGSSHLSDLYTQGLVRAGFKIKTADEHSAAKGLFRVAAEAKLFTNHSKDA